MTSNIPREIRKNTAQEFVDYFRSNPHLKTRDVWSSNSYGLNRFLFRGQANANWKLEPSAFRAKNKLAAFQPLQHSDAPEDESSRRQWLGFQLHSELRAEHLFLESADAQGLPTPIDYMTVKEHADLMFYLMNHKTKDNVDGPFPNDDFIKEPFPAPALLRGLALAQHHGVPTRLLDWSESPYIAAYFAAVRVGHIHSEMFSPVSGLS